MRVIFIRHGQTDSNVNHLLDTAYPGAPLNARGLAQAQALVQRLGDQPIELVASSDITRAMQTAEPLAESKGLAVKSMPQFREIYAGAWEMSPLQMTPPWGGYVEVIESWINDPSLAMPGGDSGVGFFERYDAGLTALAGHDCVAVVSHGAAMRTWLAVRCHLQMTADPIWMLHNTDQVVVEGEPGDWRCLEWAGRQL
ncbi:MAG: histidine phosphatase family protein [Propionibacteriaceae bacterium]|jgi:probable phosphoglycerate mutase|nr:histidine phosphatase family protein [Propionibacteriaceae bacterium]